jgi:hypothetical protein
MQLGGSNSEESPCPGAKNALVFGIGLGDVPNCTWFLWSRDPVTVHQQHDDLCAAGMSGERP